MLPRDGRSASATSRRVHISVVCGCSRNKQVAATRPTPITLLRVRDILPTFLLLVFVYLISQVYLFYFHNAHISAFSKCYVSVWRFFITSHSYRHFGTTSDIHLHRDRASTRIVSYVTIVVHHRQEYGLTNAGLSMSSLALQGSSTLIFRLRTE